MKIGFLGAGAMGGAILSGALETGVVKAENVYVYDISEKIKEKYQALGCNIVSSNEELGNLSDIVVCSLKPQYAEVGLKELGNTLDGKALISIMAGVTTETLRKWTAGDFRLLRLMPNTPALVGAGAFALDSGTDLTEQSWHLGVIAWN